MKVVIVLALTALLTSIVSAILGMGGGIMLLATMLCFMPHAEAIPTHAAVQIASNGTRVMVFLRNVDRSCLGQFIIGVLPGSALGMLLLWLLGAPDQSEPFLKTLIGVFILVVTFLPKASAPGPSKPGLLNFTTTGLLAGTAALTVGAVGPLIAPLFARRGFVKEGLIATKAVCQLTTHVLKIPAFILLGRVDIARLGGLTLILICMVIPGTLIGRRLLGRVSERQFVIAYRVMLVLAGAKLLIFDGLYGWFRMA